MQGPWGRTVSHMLEQWQVTVYVLRGVPLKEIQPERSGGSGLPQVPAGRGCIISREFQTNNKTDKNLVMKHSSPPGQIAPPALPPMPRMLHKAGKCCRAKPVCPVSCHLPSIQHLGLESSFC